MSDEIKKNLEAEALEELEEITQLDETEGLTEGLTEAGEFDEVEEIKAAEGLDESEANQTGESNAEDSVSENSGEPALPILTDPNQAMSMAGILVASIIVVFSLVFTAIFKKPEEHEAPEEPNSRVVYGFDDGTSVTDSDASVTYNVAAADVIGMGVLLEDTDLYDHVDGDITGQLPGGMTLLIYKSEGDYYKISDSENRLDGYVYKTQVDTYGVAVGEPAENMPTTDEGIGETTDADGYDETATAEFTDAAESTTAAEPVTAAANTKPVKRSTRKTAKTTKAATTQTTAATSEKTTATTTAATSKKTTVTTTAAATSQTTTATTTAAATSKETTATTTAAATSQTTTVTTTAAATSQTTTVTTAAATSQTTTATTAATTSTTTTATTAADKSY